LNPFAQLPRRTEQKSQQQQQQQLLRKSSSSSANGGGWIYMFGENVDATRLGKSKSNRKWLLAAYGETVGTQWLADKPTICSGATVGEWIAMETYLRAMVAEADHTGVTLAGADQGFHNYLHYSHKLAHATDMIRGIVVFDQGQGIVNNMGAMRTKPLEEWGNGKIVQFNETTKEYTVLNWDGMPSPVVHQFDRHKTLSEYFFQKRAGQYTNEWNKRKASLENKSKSSLIAVTE
jgi:hypothetical protein